MSHDQYDDGLVHAHHWAREKPLQQPSRTPRQAELAAAMAQHPEEMAEAYDDGLVHGHGWASSDGSRMPG
ncbi:hypothetical protein JYK14_01575 [Siccirubricoccus sp. KC 17139]|uniref:DUF2188 domain-containing protein n=1 Tax=Siccirubricoccus soli TaxID=2899147 RepID=A0ABT1D0P9_9PROT|nr:hypothetical protein [Siccirubricoccus soli]MCO6414865.1 hypothetical protein [Siccirubricoccus soli]MCP2680995.1 hypothetical protein [Siccirubricoccus soli]